MVGRGGPGGERRKGLGEGRAQGAKNLEEKGSEAGSGHD